MCRASDWGVSSCQPFMNIYRAAFRLKQAALLFGVVIVLAVVFMPKGIIDLAGGLRRDGLQYFLQNVRAHRL